MSNDILSRYEKMLESKRHSVEKHGIEPRFIPDALFDFQKFGVEKAVRMGRCALFFDTGLGKTVMELVIAENYVRHTNKPVLILTPLAVAFQFMKEAEAFGIEGVNYSKDGSIKGRIVLCNYERLHYFNPADFDCVICDESSILKSFKGATQASVTGFLKKVKYRFLATATPSPNDFIELGTSSEALGYMGYTDMLTKFFTNNEDTISPQGIGVKWRLKGHAQDAFFQWVAGWSISMRKPSDFGFSDDKHILPNLIINDHQVKNDNPFIVNGQLQMFNIVARTQSEIRAEQKATIEKRCEKAINLTSGYDFSVYWCNLNQEGDLLQKTDKDAIQLKGGMSIDQKEEILIAFSNGQIKKIITKPKITAFGLNWQHCNHAITFPGFSYEQYYQLVRRFYRFGQKRDVFIDRVISDGQTRVIQALDVKAAKADELFSRLNDHANNPMFVKQNGSTCNISIPSFLK